MPEKEKSTEELWQEAVGSLDPRVKDGFEQLRRGEITHKGLDRVFREVYDPTPKEEAIGLVTQGMFLLFLRGTVTKEELDNFIELLNENPDAVLTGEGIK